MAVNDRECEHVIVLRKCMCDHLDAEHRPEAVRKDRLDGCIPAPTQQHTDPGMEFPRVIRYQSASVIVVRGSELSLDHRAVVTLLVFSGDDVSNST